MSKLKCLFKDQISKKWDIRTKIVCLSKIRYNWLKNSLNSTKNILLNTESKETVIRKNKTIHSQPFIEVLTKRKNENQF